MGDNTNETLENIARVAGRKGKILISTMGSPFLDSEKVFPYLGILYLLSVAKSLGFRVKYIEKPMEIEQHLHSFDLFYTDTVEHSDMSFYNNFDMIALSVLTPQGEEAQRLLEQIKGADREKIVIVGGPHPNHYLDECLATGYDIIVQGDGERIFKHLLEGDVAELKKYVRSRPESAPIVLRDQLSAELMNDYPIPLREREYIYSYKYELDGQLATTMVNSRGCPMGCKFCEDSRTVGRWYGVDHFEEELASIVELGINSVMIFDDLFALSSSRLKPYAEILERYHRFRGLTYRCFAHARSIASDPGLIPLLSESGCIEVGFGAESGCQKILDVVGKCTTVAMNRELIENFISNNIKVKSFFMIGLPGETHYSAQKTGDFIKHYRRKYPSMFDFDMSVFFPYKGTLIGSAIRLRDGEEMHVGRESITNKRFNIRLIPELSWSDIDSHSYGAYKKKGGASDLIIETYDHGRGKILLKAEEIKRVKEKIMNYSKRYTDPAGNRIFTPVKEGNI
ncbi:MAG: B12-binding domain-containing radical SAM protein [Deltaproteobacteria bacterium]|nr:B12-binding domain-containing radical SAM protein [Deltaproteobacteria bacterium]